MPKYIKVIPCLSPNLLYLFLVFQNSDFLLFCFDSTHIKKYLKKILLCQVFCCGWNYSQSQMINFEPHKSLELTPVLKKLSFYVKFLET